MSPQFNGLSCAILFCLWSLPFFSSLSFNFLFCLPLQKLGDHNHTLLALIKECLSNKPTCRPDTKEVLRRLKEFRIEAEGDEMHMDRLHLIERLQMVQSDLVELEVKLNIACIQTMTT